MSLGGPAGRPVMSPLEFMQRLAALVPRPRLHLIRSHGVLAPNAKLRPMVVPQEPATDEEPASEAATAAECDIEHAPALPGRIGWARLLKRVFDRQAALPELRRRGTQDHCRHPRAADGREGLDPPGSGSAVAQRPGARGGANVLEKVDRHASAMWSGLSSAPLTRDKIPGCQALENGVLLPEADDELTALAR
jgi:hypothetical protein